MMMIIIISRLAARNFQLACSRLQINTTRQWTTTKQDARLVPCSRRPSRRLALALLGLMQMAPPEKQAKPPVTLPEKGDDFQ